MARLGLVGRIMLIVTIALVAIQLAALVTYYDQRDGWFGSGRGVPVIASVIALVRLLDRLPDEDRHLALAAAEAGSLTATIIPRSSTALTEDVPLPRVRAVFERALASAGLGDRFVSVGFAGVEEGDLTTRGPIRRMIGRHIRVAVGLADGNYLAVGFADRLTLRLFGLPLGFLAGVLGALVALFAIVAVARETRPLTRLARKVERIGTTLEPLAIEAEGAREVRSLIAAINGMQERITTLVNSRTLMLGAISHDLRTYLTRLRLRTEMMPEGPLRDGAMRDVDAMRDLVEDALLYAKASLDGDGGPTDAASVAAEVIEMRRATGAAVTLASSDAPVMVPLGRPALTRVLDNLVDNALAYGGSAEIAVQHDARGGAVIAVADRGPGIPPAERERVFEPFYRLEGSRSRDHGGTGLGLTIVQQLVGGAGGTITLSDREGGGLTVTLRLPQG